MIGERLTDEKYWSDNWRGKQRLPKPVDPSRSSLADTVDLAWHGYFRRAFAHLPPGSRLLEIGAARSRWLPYFAREFGFAVTGLDYAEAGCADARAILEAAGVAGEVVHTDLFAPPPDLLGRFQAVVSFGVVEHFTDTAACIAACARLLAPGGTMVTTIPNMRGSVGRLQRLLADEVYRLHVPLRPRDLAEAHRRAGLKVLRCGYEQTANWRVVVVDPELRPAYRRALRHGLAGASKLVWALERRGLRVRPNRLSSPYVACLARLDTVHQ